RGNSAQSGRHIVSDFEPVAMEVDDTAAAAELSLLRDVLRLLPAGVTVQDAHGRMLMVNDAAASQLGLADDRPTLQMDQGREAASACLNSGQGLVTEDAFDDGKVLLTSHRPVRIGGRDLLISSSADISEQKAFEDHLFRSAFYDELTELPSRRVIEHRVNALLRDEDTKFALAFLD